MIDASDDRYEALKLWFKSDWIIYDIYKIDFTIHTFILCKPLFVKKKPASGYPRNATLFKLQSTIYFYFTEKCLVIRGDGNLNEYDCGNFLSGCPSDDYNSSEIYKCTYLFNVFIALPTIIYVNLIYSLLKSSSKYEGL